MVTALLVVLSLAAGSADLTDEGVIDVQPSQGFSGQIVLGTRARVLFEASYGIADRANQIPVENDTLFDIGSLTKQVTAAGVMMLVQDGRLELDEPLSAFFDSLPEGVAGQTVHTLLTHAAGLPQYSGDDYELRTRESFDAWLAASAIDGANPGSFSYSNSGYSALARIIEIRSGQDFETFVHERMLAPGGICAMGYRLLPARVSEAIGYAGGEALGRPREQSWLDDGPSWNLRGNGGLLASAETLYRWAVALTGGDILNDVHTAQLFQPYVVRNAERDMSYGYGWDIVGHDPVVRVSHSGGNLVFVAYLEWQPVSDCFIAVTSNAYDESNIGEVIGQARAAIARAPECTRSD